MKTSWVNHMNLEQFLIVARMAADERVAAPYVRYVKQLVQATKETEVNDALDILMDYIPDLVMELRNAPSAPDPNPNTTELSYMQMKNEWDRVVERSKVLHELFDPMSTEVKRISVEIHIMDYVDRRDSYYNEQNARWEDLRARIEVINYAYNDTNYKLSSLQREVSFYNNITAKIRR